jgi:hypothetical protein
MINILNLQTTLIINNMNNISIKMEEYHVEAFKIIKIIIIKLW